MHWIFKQFMEERYTLCVTTDILMEYEEIIARHMGSKVAEDVIQTIVNADNTQLVNRYYQWNLIAADYDDNKFSDCAIASNARYLVSHDGHFDGLKQIDFPKIDVIRVDEFQRVLSL